MMLPPIRQRGTRRPQGPQSYWGANGQVTVTPSSPGEAASLQNQSRLYDPNYQFSSPDKFREAAMKYGGGRPGYQVFGPEGPPGGPAKLGLKMEGPQGASMPGQGPLQWSGIPQSQQQVAQAAALRNRGP